jgi:hypothetical protein
MNMEITTSWLEYTVKWVTLSVNKPRLVFLIVENWEAWQIKNMRIGVEEYSIKVPFHHPDYSYFAKSCFC